LTLEEGSDILSRNVHK